MSDNNHGLGEIIAHWNLEHTPAERKSHLDWAQKFLKESGLDRFMTARARRPSELWSLGWPKTRIDLRLRKPYCGRTYRHRGTGARVTGLSVIRLTFAHQAGVYDLDKHCYEVRKRTDGCTGAEQAAEISAWKGWEGAVCEYSLRTDARHIAYRCRIASGYGGNPGDAFGYGPDWADVHRQLEQVLYAMVDDLQLKYVKEGK